MKTVRWISLALCFLFTSNLFALTYKAVKAEGGEQHTMVKLANNMLTSCGDNGSKQLGQGSVTDQYNLNFILSGNQSNDLYLKNIVVFDAGWYHSIVCDMDKYCLTFGTNTNYCLGTGTYTYNIVPTHVLAGEQDPNTPDAVLQNIVGVAAGRSGTHSLAIEDITGRVLAWGHNKNDGNSVIYGQLGAGDINNQPTPVYVHAAVQDPNTSGTEYLENIIDVSAGQFHSMALDSYGYVYTFGGSGFTSGVLGAGSSISSSSVPVKVLSGEQSETNTYLENIIAVDAGWSHCMALEALDTNDTSKNGRVYCWGNNSTGYSNRHGGRLGDGTEVSSNQPVTVHAGEQNPESHDSPLENIIAIAAGESHCLALDNNGNVWAWGAGGDYCLGQGDTENHLEAVKVKGGEQGGEYLENIVAIGSGYWHNIAIDSDGRVYTWGKNGNGKLGTGDTDSRELPTLITLPTSDGNFTVNTTLDYEAVADELNPVDPNSDELEISISVTNPIDPNNSTPVFGNLTDVDIMLYLPEGLSYDNFEMVDGNPIIDPNYNMEKRIYTWHIDSFPANTTITRTLDIYSEKTIEPDMPLTYIVRVDIGDAYGDYGFSVDVADWFEIDNGVIYVDACAGRSDGKGTSWEYPYVELQDAIARATRDANNNNEIWVAKGNYYAPDEDNFQIPMGVEIYGGFAGIADETARADRDFIENECYLYGYGCDYVVEVADSNSTTTPLLDGFIVSAGKSAGIYLNGYDLDIVNCVLTGNGYNGCSTGYGIYANNSDPAIENCIVSYNENEGVYLTGSDATITNSYIAHNGANGIYSNSTSSLDIINSVMFDNAENGIEAENTNSNTIRNCTIIANVERAVKSNSSSTEVTNSILWANSDIANTAKTVSERLQFENCSVSYSCINDPNDIAGTTSGYNATTHNTIENPNFVYSIDVDPNSVEIFCIANDSPCKDHGLNTDVQTGELDFYGLSRIYNTTVDMGAFEVSSNDVESYADINGDALVNFLDFVSLKSAWLTTSNDSSWNSDCDFDLDNAIDSNDLELFAADWLWEPFFIDDDNLISKASYDYGKRPLETATTLVPMTMSAMSMSLDSFSLDSSVSSDRESVSSLTTLSTFDATASNDPEVILVEQEQLTIKPAPEPSDLEKASQLVETLGWLDDMWYEGQIDSISAEDWIEFRETLVDSIEDLTTE